MRLEAVRPNDDRGLYKVWIRGGRGRLLLGTLVPDGQGLGLGRRLSRSELERTGCWPVTGGETVLAFSFEHSHWKREEHPEGMVKDVVLRQGLRGQSVLLRRRESGFCLAAEYRPGRPFPLPALFCLCAVERVEGAMCAVFYFDGEGNPVVPHNGSKDGKNSGTS